MEHDCGWVRTREWEAATRFKVKGQGCIVQYRRLGVERREHRLAAELRYGNLTVSGPRVNPEVEKERLQLHIDKQRRAFFSGRLLTARTF